MNKRILVFLLLSLIWGSTWLFIKIGLEVLPPLTFAGLRFGCAALILWGIALMTPIIAVLLGMVTLGEHLTWRVALGAALILAGVGAIVGEQLLAKYWKAPASPQASG